MSELTDTRAIVDLFAAADVGWWLGGVPEAERDRRIAHFRAELAATQKECETELERPVALLVEMQREPDRFRPLVQTFALPMTPRMRAMVYCVLKGAEILEVDYAYRAKQTSRTRVKLQTDAGPREFVSTEHWDAEVLHHFGLAKSGPQPLIDGYFAFRRS